MNKLNQKQVSDRNERIFREEYIKWLKKKTKADWGRKCKEYVRGCACCRANRLLEQVIKKLQ